MRQIINKINFITINIIFLNIFLILFIYYIFFRLLRVLYKQNHQTMISSTGKVSASKHANTFSSSSSLRGSLDASSTPHHPLHSHHPHSSSFQQQPSFMTVLTDANTSRSPVDSNAAQLACKTVAAAHALLSAMEVDIADSRAILRGRENRDKDAQRLMQVVLMENNQLQVTILDLLCMYAWIFAFCLLVVLPMLRLMLQSELL